MATIIKKKISDVGIKQTTVRLNKFLLDKITKEAAKRGVNKALVINERLAEAYGVALSQSLPDNFRV